MSNRTSRRLVSCMLVALTVSFASLALAASGLRPEGRFDVERFNREGGTIAVAPQAVDALDPTDPDRRVWESFRERHGGRWSVYLDQRSGAPTMVSGRGIEWFAADTVDRLTLDELERAARSFMLRDDAMTRIGIARMVRDDDASAELQPGRWRLVFRLEVDGVRVENARLEFTIDRGRLTIFGSSNWKAPEIRGVPEIDSARARVVLDDYLDGRSASLEVAAAAELVMIAVDANPSPGVARAWAGARGKGLSHVLVWRVRLREPDGPAVWTGEIDAHHGTLRAFYDGAHYAGVRGGVFPEQPDGDCSAGGCELDGFPMPFVDWAESGQPAAISDGYGSIDCVDPAATYETSLIGQYVEIDDTCGPILQQSDCSDSIELGVKIGENCEVDPLGSPGNTAAARSSYYHVNRVAEVARFYNPGNAWLHSRVPINTNWQGACNASYGGGEIYVYREGSGCANSGEIQGIAVHEWGHGYDENDGGGWDLTSEAYADMVAMFASRQSCFGPGLFTDGDVCSGYGDPCFTCTGFRDHDWAARQANTPATPQGFVQANCELSGGGDAPCGGEVHCETYPVGEAIYDLATRDLPAAGVDVDSAWQLVERLWYSSRAGSGGNIYTCALPASDSCAAGNWYQQLRVADDDDADLSNGTPHAAALFAAFDRHAIACGSSGDPENQSSSSCPVLAAPSVTITMLPAGTEVHWIAVAGASEYLVFRGDLGCSRQQVPVATVGSATTSWLDSVGDPSVTRYYRVEAIGVNPVCRSPVSNCESTPQGPRLQKNAHRLLESGPNTNGNGVLDPGETVVLPMTLFNGGLADALNVTGRLRTLDPSQGRAVEPLAAWADLAVGAQLESVAPHFELTLFGDGIDCGETVELEVEMNADGAATRSRRFGFRLGEKDREFFQVANEPMSRFVTTPILATQGLTDDTVIGELDISVAISHTRPQDLIVELSSPQGTTVRLHDLSAGNGDGISTRYDLQSTPDGPGSMADFAGESLIGTWTLSAQNTVFGGGSGAIDNWTLHVTSAGAFGCSELACAEPVPAATVEDLHVDWALDSGDGSRDLVFDWSVSPSVAGYHVLHSSTPQFLQQVDLTGRTAGAATLSVEDGVDATPALSYFQVRSINGCNEESP